MHELFKTNVRSCPKHYLGRFNRFDFEARVYTTRVTRNSSLFFKNNEPMTKGSKITNTSFKVIFVLSQFYYAIQIPEVVKWFRGNSHHLVTLIMVNYKIIIIEYKMSNCRSLTLLSPMTYNQTFCVFNATPSQR